MATTAAGKTQKQSFVLRPSSNENPLFPSEGAKLELQSVKKLKSFSSRPTRNAWGNLRKWGGNSL